MHTHGFPRHGSISTQSLSLAWGRAKS